MGRARKPQGGGISGRAYARRRGVTHAAVQKALRTGRITALADGTIDPERADAEWGANTDETKPRNSVSGDPRHRRIPGEPPAPAGSAGGPGGAPAAYTVARAMREGYLARRAKRELEQLEGSLVRADEVKAEAFAAGRRVRDAILAVPDRLAPVLAGCDDERQVHQLLTAELRAALEGLKGAV